MAKHKGDMDSEDVSPSDFAAKRRIKEQVNSKPSPERMAAELNAQAVDRQLTVPEGTPTNVVTQQEYEVWEAADVDKTKALVLIAEDESEAIRRFRLCHGITESPRCFAVAVNDKRVIPKPFKTAGSLTPAPASV